MAQRRIDRFAQMSKQEELIAKKRLEILEKQRTAELAKAVQAAQNLAACKVKTGPSSAIGDTNIVTGNIPDDIIIAPSFEDSQRNDIKIKMEPMVAGGLKPMCSLTGKTGKISFGIKRPQAPTTVTDQPAPKVQNSFCNDGSFLENFKKILEKHEKPKTNAIDLVAAAAAASHMQLDSTLTEPAPDQNVEPQPNDGLSAACQPQNAPPPPMHFTFGGVSLLPSVVGGNPFGSRQPMVSTSASLPAFFSGGTPQLVPPPPPPTTVAAALLLPTMHAVPPIVAPPPPPPPQLPMALANLPPLYMLPDPLQLNAIPAPKEFNLDAIPKPQLNFEAIQVPVIEEQTKEAEEPEQSPLTEDRDNNEHKCVQLPQVLLPTTVENLIDMIAENGDDYEDKLRTHKNQLHPAMWFLFDPDCEQYDAYRQALRQRRRCDEHFNEAEAAAAESSNSSSNTPSNQMSSQNSNSQAQQDAMDKYDPESVIDSGDIDSDDEWLRSRMNRNRDNIRRLIECRNELSEEEREERNAEAMETQEQQLARRLEKQKQRKSRWGEKVEQQEQANNSKMEAGGSASSFANQRKPVLSSVTRSDAALLQYARQNYGSTNLSEEDWKKCEEHYKINLLYQDMLRKRQELDRLARSGKFKYEYDSDEDVEGGTWEHKLRSAEMEATQAWASALNRQSEGKHHIGDFLPPEELKKFMEQYEAKKYNRQPDLSDYKEYKLKEDNIGFQMLQKLGWKEGQGLGQDGAGIVDPVNKGPQRDGNQGLGIINAATPEECDNEYDAYRKRMMLAYRFRPNPLNNPRRAYY